MEHAQKDTQGHTDDPLSNDSDRHQKIIEDLKILMKEGSSHTESLRPFDLSKLGGTC